VKLSKNSPYRRVFIVSAKDCSIKLQPVSLLYAVKFQEALYSKQALQVSENYHEVVLYNRSGGKKGEMGEAHFPSIQKFSKM